MGTAEQEKKKILLFAKLVLPWDVKHGYCIKYGSQALFAGGTNVSDSRVMNKTCFNYSGRQLQ